MTGIIGELRDFWTQMNALARIAFIGLIIITFIPVAQLIRNAHEVRPQLSYYTYTVQSGDTLSDLAAREKTKLVRNCDFNGLASDVVVTIQMKNSLSTNQLHAGQRLWLPTC